MRGATGAIFLYEYEVYNLLSLSGSETPPRSLFIPRNARLPENEIMAMPGERVVLKIVSPAIIHKTEVGGVRDRTQDSQTRSAPLSGSMLSEVPNGMQNGWNETLPRFPLHIGGYPDQPCVTPLQETCRAFFKLNLFPPILLSRAMS